MKSYGIAMVAGTLAMDGNASSNLSGSFTGSFSGSTTDEFYASGAFSGSYEGDGSNLTGIVATVLDIDNFGDDLTGATLAATDKLILSDGGTEGRVNISQFATPLAGTGLEANAGTVRIATAAAGDGLSGGGGSALAVNVDDSTIETNADTLRVKDAGITEAKLATSVAGDGLAGGGGTALSVNVDDSTIEITTDALNVKDAGITNAKLANNSIIFGATSQALGSTITTISGLTLISADTGTFVHQIFESASTIITSGSNVFGNDAADTQQITGSLLLTGSFIATAPGATINGAAIVTGSAQIDHDTTTNFVANEHIDHTSVTITAGDGLTGGGDITTTRTLTIGAGTGITVNADDIQIADNGVGATQLNVAGNGSNGQYLGSDGDGSFTWTSVPAGYSVANSSDNRILTAVDSTNGNAESNLTFDGSTLGITGNVNASSTGQFSSIGVNTAPSGVAGAILATNDVVAFASSDERLKENLEPIGSAVEKVEQLTGYTYNWIPMEGVHVYGDMKDVGVIAQEVEKVLPELVSDRENGYKAVKYDKLTAVLIQAVKELSARIKELESK